MSDPLYPPFSSASARKRAVLAPEPLTAFKAFRDSVFADGALPRKTKELIAVVAAHITQCPYCNTRPNRSRAEKRRQRAGNHEGHPGCHRNARRGGLRSFDAGYRSDEPLKGIATPCLR